MKSVRNLLKIRPLHAHILTQKLEFPTPDPAVVGHGYSV